MGKNINIEMIQKCIKIEKMNEKLDVLIKKLNLEEKNNVEYNFYILDDEEFENFKNNFKNFRNFGVG